MAHYLADPLEASGAGKGVVLGEGQWDRQVDAFDVKGLADQLEDIGVKYYLISIGQNTGYYCSPNATYDEIVGIEPSKCSRRDLIADLSKELKPRGIRLMVYLPSGAPASDHVARTKLKWRWGRPGGWQLPGEPTGGRLVEFQRNWEAVIREWSLRWGTHVAGWWIDGCYFADEMYRFEDPPNFASLAAALKAGNPDAIVTFNKPGQADSTHEDYTAGELWIKGREVSVCPGRWVDCRDKKLQYHALTYLGSGWGVGDAPRYSTADLIKYTRRVTDGGGVMTWDVPCRKNGLFAPGFVEPLKTLHQDLKKDTQEAAHAAAVVEGRVSNVAAYGREPSQPVKTDWLVTPTSRPAGAYRGERLHVPVEHPTGHALDEGPSVRDPDRQRANAIGVQACYRGPRIYDTDQTKAVVKRQVDFYKKYRAILDSDVIHGRRPDGRDVDWILHVNPTFENKGMLVVYNPLNREVTRSILVPPYYTGLTEAAAVSREGGRAKPFALARDYTIELPVTIAPESMTWFVIR